MREYRAAFVPESGIDLTGDLLIKDGELEEVRSAALRSIDESYGDERESEHYGSFYRKARERVEAWDGEEPVAVIVLYGAVVII
jgi:hypothetical protein